jgi:TPR repeat protein
MSTSRTTLLAGLVAFLFSSVSPPSAEAAQRPQTFAPDGNDPVALRCDRLANSRSDPQRVGDGVGFEQIDVGQALPVCRGAAERRPVRPRYQYLYGRLLDAAKRQSEAAQLYAAADQAGYALATESLGELYKTGQGVPIDPAMVRHGQWSRGSGVVRKGGQ